MAAEKYVFLDEVGVQNLSTAILSKVNTRIGERIVTTMSESVTDTQVMSAKAVKTLLGWSATETKSVSEKIDDVNDELTKLKNNVSSLTHLEYETFIGSVDELTKKDGAVNLERDPQKIYLQKDNEADPTWVMYAFIPSAWSTPEDDTPAVPTAGQWIVVGDTSIDLVNYWSKDEASVAELREALKIHDAEALSNSTITAAVENAFLMTEEYNTVAKVAVTYGAGVTATNYGNTIASGSNVPTGVKLTFAPTGLDAEKSYTYAWTVTVDGTDTTYTTETVDVTVAAATNVELVVTEVTE